ncbi:MAG: type II toxin-antitoxin system VapC family toxin [Afipia sp.]|uniref:Ribonuclease VapC n=1 Tax=Bradyrhizobium denitrificans TaxID=2734912 RepID=A0ABS5GBJ0_9BRAD|nr:MULTISPECIES: type II toxin-antitoxin system VapC family toxin [Alphaproteobacteria]MBN9581612.1 type II toxin-antitoxin system VapC family toxin [Afipia sp.]MCW5622949.1 type II toxin-antitoxin system VapC family toxin [Burkholderiales bacterium]MCW5701527.1 type II toxin-antitoxin system VapC family toxin [Bradyrhizobium sp.]ODT20915.1 MAG: twitching motility protein PilT [Kaistia sp. SCN 65-12]TXH14328.1 MAG: type II toxin-antitoxin system VapC family toxin [Gammaproteobacteria bacterium
MNYLLDTNVVSELRKIGDGKADARVAAWVDTEDAESFFISAITILELERGVLGIQRRDAAQGARLRAWLDNHVRPEFAGRILPIDDQIAMRCAHLHIPDRRNEVDALIAATALVHGLTVATRNVRDFEGTGVVVVNPWQD